MENYESGYNAADYLGGKYLKKEDIAGETPVTIVEVRPETLPGEGRQKLVAYFQGKERGLVLNSTNTRRLATFFESMNTAHWRGPVVLYVDDNVEFSGSRVGGLRVKPAQVNGVTLSDKQRYERKTIDSEIAF